MPPLYLAIAALSTQFCGPARAESLGPAHGGDDGWAPALAAPAARGAAEVAAGAVYAPGYVPPFRAGARDRLAFGVGGRWMPDDRVQLSLGFDGLSDRSAAGTVTGPGDVRLGATVRVAQVGPARGWLGFAAKLPDARDESELGTDETDVTFGGGVEVHGGPLRAFAGAALGVWGNPLRFANQDDVPLLRAGAVWDRPGGGLQLGVAFDADVGTARNPARVQAGGWVRGELRTGAVRPFLELGGGAGLTPAAPDGIGTAALGLAWGPSRAPSPLSAPPPGA